MLKVLSNAKQTVLTFVIPCPSSSKADATHGPVAARTRPRPCQCLREIAGDVTVYVQSRAAICGPQGGVASFIRNISAATGLCGLWSLRCLFTSGM